MPSWTRTWTRAALLSTLAAAAIAGGCGDEGGEEGSAEEASAPSTVTEAAPLAPAEANLLLRTRSEVDSYCVHVGARVAEGREPDSARFAAVSAQIDRLTELAREKPLAPSPDGSTPRFALGDIAEDLEGSNCDTRLARKIDEALATLPQE